MTQKIRYAEQQVLAEDILAVENVLRSDFLTQGPATEAFEKNLASAVGAEFSIACNSATSALTWPALL